MFDLFLEDDEREPYLQRSNLYLKLRSISVWI